MKEGLNLDEISAKLESHTLSGFPLGEKDFVEKVSEKVGRNLKKKKRGRPKKVSVPI